MNRSRIFFVVILSCFLSLGWSQTLIAKNIEEQLSKAQQALDNSQYQQALGLLHPLAKNNNAQAQYLLGRLMADSHLAKYSVADGVKWLEKAVANRHMDAAHVLGRMYLSGFGVTLNTQKGAHYMTLAEEFRPEDEPANDCD